MNFDERLKHLPSVAHLAALHISSAIGQALVTLEPKLGQVGPSWVTSCHVVPNWAYSAIGPTTTRKWILALRQDMR